MTKFFLIIMCIPVQRREFNLSPRDGFSGCLQTLFCVHLQPSDALAFSNSPTFFVILD